MLDIKKKQDGTCLEIILKGKIDTSTAPKLDEIIEDCVNNYESVILDLKDLNYITSAGLRSILSLHKKMSKKGGLVIKGINEAILEIFDFTGFTDILNIE